jgi:glyoxylase-like metal-dependent hydrolase (beta-lactamase superfamily II)
MTGMIPTRSVETFKTQAGGKIFQLPLEAFPDFWTYAYLVLVSDPQMGEMRVLIDTGSGFGNSNEQLEIGLHSASEQASEEISIANLTHILITHAHIDHFGGLMHIRSRSQARLGIHELDRRVLTNYEERLALITRRMEEFLNESGVSSETQAKLLHFYTIPKEVIHSMQVDFSFEAIDMRLGPFEFLHVPGHCAGHVVIRLHDVLFTGDHVLDDISPHQSPERLTLSTGLEHYLISLEKLKDWCGPVALTLGGHNKPIKKLSKRIDEIKELHRERLNRVLEYLELPHTIAEVSEELFGEVRGYNVLLALEEAGAHVEYLYQRGLIRIENLSELENGRDPIPIRYQKL